MIAIDSLHCVRRARESGCTAQTVGGLLRWLRAHPLARRDDWSTLSRALTPPRAHKLTGWQTVALYHAALQDDALAGAAIHGRKRVSASPTIDPEQHGRVREIDHGRYSSRCTYSKIEYQGRYFSRARIRGGRAVVYSRHEAPARIIRVAGITWRIDDYGLAAVARDGTDWHVHGDDLERRDFARWLRQQMTDKRRKLRDEARATAQRKRDAAIRARALHLVRVTIADSRAAGNCVEGTLAWAERRLGLDRSAAMLASVPAVEVLAADPHNPQVRRAVDLATDRALALAI